MEKSETSCHSYVLLAFDHKHVKSNLNEKRLKRYIVISNCSLSLSLLPACDVTCMRQVTLMSCTGLIASDLLEREI